MTTTTSPVPVISYASTDVKTHARRSAGGTLLRWVGRGAAALLFVLRLMLLGAGFTIVAAGQLCRLLLGAAGALLLLLGGLRWFEVKKRLMRGANWVDRTTLRIVRAVTRNPFVEPLRA